MKITVPADAANNKNILTLLEEMGYELPCNCGGRKLCPGTNYAFDCSLIPHEPTTILLSEPHGAVHGISLENKPLVPGHADTLLIDLGTTTVALVLIDKKSGALRQTCVFSNPQRILGADVISRIQASCSGSERELASLIQDAITRECTLLCKKNNQSGEDITSCLIGGNTTMIHLLMGYSCRPLAASPFVPEQNTPAPFVIQNATVRILPWLSAFVGGDITAGVVACHLASEKKTSLLIDLGTNGEMVLAHKNELYTASTAAGPALEGASLSCGCAAIPGAISHVRLRRNHAVTNTIDNKLPVGLCGSGAFSLLAELLRNGLLQKDGVLADSFPEEGIFLGTAKTGKKLLFTAQDLRELQLAVAAVGAGIDTLCHEAKISSDEIEAIYVGGGFGMFLDTEDCILVRMLPDIPAERIVPKGNTCLQGLYELAAKADDDFSCLFSLPHHSVNLANHEYFKKQFLLHMTY